MRLKDIVELIMVDMPDYTEGAFDVRIESDDGGTHIVIAIDNHKNSNKILDVFSSRFNDSRVIVMKVPEGSLYSE
jgi:hypothetical protein